MTCRFAVSITFALLLCGCGDSPLPVIPADNRDPAILAGAYNYRGGAYSKRGDHDAAIKDYSEAIRLKPDFALAYNNRGTAYGKKGEYDEAIKDWSEAIRLDPDNAHNYGVARSRLAKSDADFKKYDELKAKKK